ncbi:uncharacterized protein [Cherax quadricarinatus]|uniref:uncharacterized protein isoform X2 n=1 Tax=Cherax quadricarinatus TaxID=27406 RepID=UPI00387E26C5
MALYHDGGRSSVSASGLRPVLMCGSGRPSPASATSPRSLSPLDLPWHSPHDPPWHSPRDAHRHSFNDPRRHSPRHSPSDPPRHSPRHSPRDPLWYSPPDPPRQSPRHSPPDPPHHSPRHSPHDPPWHSPPDPSRHSPHDPPRHSPHDPPRHSPRHSPHDPPWHSPHDPPRHSPYAPPRHSLRHSPHDPPRHLPRHSPQDPSQQSPHDPQQFSPQDPLRHPPQDPPRNPPLDQRQFFLYKPPRRPSHNPPHLSPLDPPRLSPLDPPRLSPLDPPRLSPLDPPRLSPLDPPRVSPLDVAPWHSPADDPALPSNPTSNPTSSDPTSRTTSPDPNTKHTSPDPAPPDPAPPDPAQPDPTTYKSANSAYSKFSRRGTDLSVTQVKLQETYINVVALEEREEEKQLSEAWKRKRRRSLDRSLDRSVPEYLKSAPIKRISHPLEQSFLVSFLVSVTSVVLTCVISVPLSLALLLALPVGLLVKALAALCRVPRTRSCVTACHSDYVSAHDAQFLLEDAGQDSVIHSILIIDASINLKRIKQLLATRVVDAKNGSGSLMYPRLTQTIMQMPAGPAWVQDHNFNLHNHVVSGPSISTEEGLQRYVSALLSQPLPLARPLWQMVVLHDYGRSRDTVLVCRLHQSISDGMSLVRVLCHSLSDNQIMHIPQKPHFGGTTYGMNLFKALLVGPLTALKWLWWWGPEINLLTVRRGTTVPPARHPKSTKSCCGCHREVGVSRSSESGAYTVWGGGEGRGEGQVVVWSAAVPLSRVARIKQVTRTCLNDVLLAALTGALRLTFQSQGVRHPPDLKVNVAVDLRGNTLPFNIPRLGTKAALVPLSLPLSWDGAIPRLWEVRARVSQMKASAEAVVSYGLVWWASHVMPSSWVRWLLHALHGRTSLQYSSLPGPTSSLLLGGYTVKHIFNVSPPRAPTPVSVTVFTYADQVHLSVAARRTLPAAHALTAALLKEFENQCVQMSELLANRRIPGEQRRTQVFSFGELDNSQSITDLQIKLGRVQAELQLVTQHYESQLQATLAERRQHLQENAADAINSSEASSGGEASELSLLSRSHSGGSVFGCGARSPTSRQDLATRVQKLKDEFTDLLTEIRRRKSVSDSGGSSGGIGVAVQTEVWSPCLHTRQLMLGKHHTRRLLIKKRGPGEATRPPQTQLV